MYKILIIEDDQSIARSIKDILLTWGYKVAICENFKDVLNIFVEEKVDLVLLDIGLPFYNGFYWCAKIRAVSHVPIIFISSSADSLNIVTAINQGADDFVEKPFDSSVLVAKVQAQLRRAYDLTHTPHVVVYDDYQLDLGHMTFSNEQQAVELTKNELKIMQCLIAKRGQVVSRSELMHALWDSDCFIDDNTLTVNMARLRKKLHEKFSLDMIMTKKGRGYFVE